ncbi:MAG TPA: LLM class flavin-dependent oxidoreductase [Dehalococcoidia bacterium]|nr:LLM class flavin-dependent oxidoreductase [Dehalococcoidia bacterium]
MTAFEFGIFHEFACRDDQHEAEAFAEGFALVDAAEAWGLDAVWLAELHFSPRRSVLASPLTLASAIAARTERLLIGTAVQVLPLAQPVRLAEDAATVDQISHGRLIFGVGRSGFQRVYEAYGIAYAESRDRFAEALEVIRAAWTEPEFSYHGRFYTYDRVTVTPRPYRQPHPPIRVAANSPDTFPAIGSQGLPIFVAVRLGTLSELGPNIAAYRAAYRAAGHPGEGEVYLRVPVYVAESEERARREPEASIMSFYRTLGARLEGSAGQAGARAIEQRGERGQRLQNVTWEDAQREKVIVGAPRSVKERLLALRAELGLDGVLAELNCGGAIPYPQVHEALRLLCTEVIPAFRQAAPPASREPA